MKKAYEIMLMALAVMVLSWFLPWLYSIVFPSGQSEPFVAFSPVSGQFVVTQTDSDKNTEICGLNADGSKGEPYTKDERDSLLPQIYYTQLIGREKLPDSISGVKVGVSEFKHSQWIFNSHPRDINKRIARVRLMMESMPERFELEDPEVVFRFTDDGGVEFIDMMSNRVMDKRSRSFSSVFADRGFRLPLKSASANVTTRKPRDEGYLMVDAAGDVYHLKMQAGRPYMTKLRKPESIVASHVFILENPETTHIGLMTDEDHNLYAIEREGYRMVRLPVGKVDPEVSKITVFKTIFNWVVKVSGPDGVSWTAIDSDDYSMLGRYSMSSGQSASQRVASFIFPFEISFTSVSDCYARPRVDRLSWQALWLNIVLALGVLTVSRRREQSWTAAGVKSAVTLVCGVFSFIPFMLIKD